MNYNDLTDMQKKYADELQRKMACEVGMTDHDQDDAEMAIEAVANLTDEECETRLSIMKYFYRF